MCDPVTASVLAASAAAQVGGSMINAQGENHNQRAALMAKNESTGATLQNLNNDAAGSQKVFQNVTSNYQGTKPADNLAAAQTNATANLNANTPQALASGAITSNAPAVVQESSNNDIASRFAKLAKSNQALGAVQGYGDNNAANGRALSDAGAKESAFGNFAAGDANVGQALSQQNVQNSQKAISPWGDILKGVGQVGSLAAGSGLFSGLGAINPVAISPMNTSIFQQGYLLPSG